MDNLLIYLRKSRADNAGDSVEEVLAKHERLLQEYSVRVYGERISDDRVLREVESGETISSRPMMRLLLKTIERGDIDGVLVVDPQRLTRGDLSECGRVVREFLYTDTKIITPGKTYDLTNKFDKRFFEQELIRGNDYLEYVREVLNRGKIESLRAGHYISAVPPYGYDISFLDEQHRKEPYLVINEDKAAVVRLIFNLYANENVGVDGIVRRLKNLGIEPPAKKWSVSTIRYILKNETYCGKIVWGKREKTRTVVDGDVIAKRKTRDEYMIFSGLHEPIIDDETFERVAGRMARNPRVVTSKKISNPVAGLFFCGRCGRAMILKNRKQLYVCSNQIDCRTKSVPYDLILESIVSAIRNNIENIESETSSYSNQSLNAGVISSVKSEIANLEAQEERQMEMYERGVYTADVFLSRNRTVKEKISTLKIRLSELENEKNSQTESESKIVTLYGVLDRLESNELTAGDLNALFRNLFQKIVYNTEENSENGKRIKRGDFWLDIYFLL